MKKFILSPLLLLLLFPAASWADGPKAELKEERTRYGKISYPVLSGVADKEIEASINAVMKEEAATWNCDFDGERESVEGLDYNAWTTVHLIDGDFFSYTVSKDYFCGSAHPVQQRDAHNFSVKTGASIPIDALIAPDNQGAKLTEFLLPYRKFAVEGCADAYVDINWDYYRTSDTIVFLPRLPGNTNKCFEEFSIPIKQLIPIMRVEIEEDRD